jgi:hypothetical protein
MFAESIKTNVPTDLLRTLVTVCELRSFADVDLEDLRDLLRRLRAVRTFGLLRERLHQGAVGADMALHPAECSLGILSLDCLVYTGGP